MKKVSKYLVSKDIYHLNKKVEQGFLDEQVKTWTSHNDIEKLKKEIQNTKNKKQLQDIYEKINAHISLSPQVYQEIINMLKTKREELK